MSLYDKCHEMLGIIKKYSAVFFYEFFIRFLILGSKSTILEM